MNVWAVNGEGGRKRQTRRRGDKGGRQDERGKRRGRKERSRTEGSTERAANMRNQTTELRQTRKKRRGGGRGEVEELSVGSTSTDLFPRDVFSSVTKDRCRTCSPVFQIKTITPPLCCRGSGEEHDKEDEGSLPIGFAVEQSARARPCTDAAAGREQLRLLHFVPQVAVAEVQRNESASFNRGVWQSFALLHCCVKEDTVGNCFSFFGEIIPRL